LSALVRDKTNLYGSEGVSREHFSFKMILGSGKMNKRKQGAYSRLIKLHTTLDYF